MNNRRGMTLIEALIVNIILITVIVLSLNLFKDNFTTQLFLERSFNLVIARNRLVSHLLDSQTWRQTVKATENTAFKCLLKQNLADASGRNCNDVVDQKINIYSLDSQKVFDLQNPNLGFDKDGNLCTSFVPSPGAGNATCPIGIDFTITAQCDAGLVKCFNPSFQMNGSFNYNDSARRTLINLAPFNFSLLISGLHCPVQSAGVGWVGDSEIAANATQVEGMTAASQVGHVATTDPLLLPCRRSQINFSINSANYKTSVVGNQTRVCLVDELAGTCQYSLLHKLLADGTLTYDLIEAGAVVATKPSWITLAGNENFEFQVVNGLVKFCMDSQCLYFFERKMDSPFRVQASPGWVNAAGLDIVDSLMISAEEL